MGPRYLFLVDLGGDDLYTSSSMSGSRYEALRCSSSGSSSLEGARISSRFLKLYGMIAAVSNEVWILFENLAIYHDINAHASLSEPLHMSSKEVLPAGVSTLHRVCVKIDEL